MALLIALLSCLTSIILIFALEEANWQTLVLVANIDIFFFWWVSISNINYIVRQRMCSILAISIFFSMFWSLISLLYVANASPIINLVFDNLDNYSYVLGLILTLLLIIVSITPWIKRLLYGFRRMDRADTSIDLFDNCDNQNYQDSEKDPQ